MRQRMADYIERKIPSDLRLTLLSDQAAFVKAAISEVRTAGIVGGMLAIIVCFLFLRRLAPTLVIGLSIPISVIATFGPMYVGGVSLNVMSLGGLALGIGMLVDNTIVVLESIARCREDGDAPLEAALRGVREVGGAVTASTLTTVAVFAPIVFVEGIAGQTFGDQAMTVVASLTISLAVALFFIPGVTARLDRKIKPVAAADRDSETTDQSSRVRQFFRGCRLPRSKKAWGLVVVLLLVGLALSGASKTLVEQKLAELPVYGDNEPEFDDLEKAQRMPLVWMGFVGNACLLGATWWFLEYVFTLLGRTIALLVRGVRHLLWPLFGAVGVSIRWLLWPLSVAVDRLLGGIQRIYPAMLRFALGAPWLVIGIAGVMAFFAFTMSKNLGRELLPEVLQREFTAEVILPAGSPLEDTDRFAKKLEAQFRQLPGVQEAAVVSGADRDSVSTGRRGAAHITDLGPYGTGSRRSTDRA